MILFEVAGHIEVLWIKKAVLMNKGTKQKHAMLSG